MVPRVPHLVVDGRPGVPASPARPRPGAHAATVLAALLALVLALALPGIAAASDPWTAPDSERGVVHGVVLDDAGRPLEGVIVDASATRRVGGGSQATGSHTLTDEHGRYRVVLVDDRDLIGDGFYVTSRKSGYMDGANGKPVPPTTDWSIRPVRPGAGDVTRVDLAMRRRSATVSGRITVRGGAPAAEQLRVWVLPEGERRDLDDVTLHDDGRYEVRVPAGALSVSAQSRFGLPRNWLGPQPGGGPARNRLVVGSDEHHSGVDIELPARLPHHAVDQYGTLHDGYDPQDSIPHPAPRYPIDETPHPGSTVGPVARFEPFRMPHAAAGLSDVPWLAQPWGFNRYEIPVLNDGDHDLWIREVRFEGRDAALFRCEVHVMSGASLPCRSGELVHGRYGVVPFELKGATLPVVVNQDVHRDVYEATAVIVTNAPGSPHRVPMRVVNLTAPLAEWMLAGCVASGECPAGPAGPTGPVGTGDAPAGPSDGAPAPADRSARPATILKSAVRLTRSRVRFVLPGAARGQIRIERRRTRGRKRVWSAVRRSSFSTRRAGTVTRRLKALPAGRYRVRLRVTPRGERARTITAIRRTR